MCENTKYEIIDAHCHIYPQKIAAKAVLGTDKFYNEHSSCLGTVEDVIKKGDEAGVNRFIVQSVATTPKQVKSINDFIKLTVNSFPEKFTGLGAVHPESENIKEDIDYITKLGFKGVKIHPEIQGFSLDHIGFYKIFEELEKRNMVLLMHSGDLRYDYSNPNKLVRVLNDFPNLTVVGAHFGGWSNWKEAHKMLRGISNLYVDCSSSFAYLKKNEALEIIRSYGSDRVLFGTDYPMWIPKNELDYFFDLKLSDEERKMILSENAKKVFAL